MDRLLIAISLLLCPQSVLAKESPEPTEPAATPQEQHDPATSGGLDDGPPPRDEDGVEQDSAGPVQDASPEPKADAGENTERSACPASKELSLKARISADAKFYAEIAGIQGLEQTLHGTKLLQLIQEQELQTFLSPILDGIRADLKWLMYEIENSDALVEDLSFGRMFGALHDVDIEEETAKGLFGVELPGKSKLAFDILKEAILEDDDAELIELEGRQAIRSSEDDVELTLLLEGDLVVLTFGAGVAETFATGADPSLQDAEWFRAARSGLDMQSPIALLAANVDAVLPWLAEMFEDVTTLGMPNDEEFEKMRNVIQRSMVENPMAKSVKAVAVGIEPMGEELRERWYLEAPGDRSAWLGEMKGLSDVPAKHAALSSEDADIFFSLSLNLKESIRIAEAQEARIQGLIDEEGLEGELADELTGGMFDTAAELVKEHTGVDLQEELVPVIGEAVSVYVDLPATAALSIPETGIVVELADPAGFDSILTRIIAKDEELDAVEFTEMEFKEKRLVTINLLNAGLPFLPTLAVYDDTLMISLTPQALKGLIRKIEDGKHLAASERFAGFDQEIPDDARLGLWMNSATTFNFLYGFVGVGLSALRMSDPDLGKRFDASLLPSGATIAQYLADGYFYYRETEQGLVYEGRSTLGNPVTGMFLGGLAVTGLIGASIGLEEEAASEKRKASREQMHSIALAAATYRNSVGSGAWPKDLVSLIDRGILTDFDALVDPADPKPKRVKTGTGERVKVSYAIGRTESLPEDVRERLPENCEYFLYTREPWHTWGSEDARLLIGLAEDGIGKVETIRQSEWQK